MEKVYDVVLVSNRGPVSFIEDASGFATKRGAGGLAGALDPVARELGDKAVWIAAATSEVDRRAIAGGELHKLSARLGYHVELVDVDPKTYDEYYDEVSNRMLWFAHHCLWDEIRDRGAPVADVTAWEKAYEPVNRHFADVAARLSHKRALVLFQDYHLSTSPAHLSKARPDVTILHFTHSSFCGPKGLGRLPAPIPQRVVEGMLGADLAGFHVQAWVEGFLDACRGAGAKVHTESGLIEHAGGQTWVRAYPIPIDAAQLRARAAGAATRRWAERFAEDGRRLIVRADRTEPSKNIVRGFEAFGLLLDRRRDLRESVLFVACIYPSRQSMSEYQNYVRRIQSAADRVNERHPGSIELFLKDDFDRTLGALLVYDVLLVNPIMDGMNLVSKEGPAINERAGTLVLSRGAGSFAELGDHAIEIADALDVTATAEALERALELPIEERRARADALRALAEIHTPSDWIHAQLADLALIRDGDQPATSAAV